MCIAVRRCTACNVSHGIHLLTKHEGAPTSPWGGRRALHIGLYPYEQLSILLSTGDTGAGSSRRPLLWVF
jgi:hypothetical protein